MRQTAVWFIVVIAAISSQSAEESGVESMLAEIQRMTDQTVSYTGIGAIDESIIEAMRTVNRSEFVPLDSTLYAWENRPLGIGHGQTISQPYIVALMTHLLDLEKTDRVLEIGTGSGYQAAVLSKLASRVYTIEIVPELAEEALNRLVKLKFDNVSVRTGDGWFGWPEHAPFNKIMITAVASEVPPILLEQLAEDGKLVMPLGDPRGHQELVLINKLATRGTTLKRVLPVQFVPMTGEASSVE